MNKKLQELRERLNDTKKYETESNVDVLTRHIIDTTISNKHKIELLEYEEHCTYINIGIYSLLVSYKKDFNMQDGRHCICWELDWLDGDDTYYLGGGYAVVDVLRNKIIDWCNEE